MLPSNLRSWRCENAAFVRCSSFKIEKLKIWKRSFGAILFLQIRKVEDVKTTLSCAASFKLEKLKMWKRCFRVLFPSNSKSWRCENKAFVRCFLPVWKVEDVKTKLSCAASLILKVEDVKTELSCAASFQFEKLKMWKRSFRALLASNLRSWRCENVAFVRCFL